MKFLLCRLSKFKNKLILKYQYETKISFIFLYVFKFKIFTTNISS